MMKYLMVLLSLFSGSVLGMGRVNELCGIDSVGDAANLLI